MRVFLAINPMGKVPAVRLSDGDILCDSGAILSGWIALRNCRASCPSIVMPRWRSSHLQTTSPRDRFDQPTPE
jgi:Glutathione S-transferase, N-terminal domain